MSSIINLEAWQGLGRQWQFGRHGIFYAQRGSADAPALLLLHGFPTASWDWHKQWLELNARFNCIAPDLLGFGYSAKPRFHDYSIVEQADLAEGLMAQAGVAQFHVLAHDYGDTVAQELMARDIERRGRGDAGRIQSLCLLNGGIFPEVHKARPVQELMAGPLGWLLVRFLSERAFRQNMRQIFGLETPPSDAELSAFWSLAKHNGGTRIYHRLIRYMEERRRNRDRWVNALIDCPVPLRFINGVQDPVSGLHMYERFRELIAAPDTVALDCGHYPQIEAPQECLNAILEFLDRVVDGEQ